MTLDEAITIVQQGTLENDNLSAPKRLFDAIVLVLDAARTTITSEPGDR